MLKNRIISTLRFFDLQDYPLTLLELHKFLIADLENLKPRMDWQGELKESGLAAESSEPIDSILACLDNECRTEVQNYLGFYYLSGRKAIAVLRLQNYFYGIAREKLIKKYIGGLRHLPFIRSIALGGSQAMGLGKETSDIDMLIITDQKFLCLGRTLATMYFQILGKRRHGNKIANRFCLNHYLAGPKALNQIKNLYSAMEYGRLRPLVYPQITADFQENNTSWIKQCFPNWQPVLDNIEKISPVQKILESLFTNKFGSWVEKKLKDWQIPRIKKQKFIIVEDDELSFHPDSKQELLLLAFFNKTN